MTHQQIQNGRVDFQLRPDRFEIATEVVWRYGGTLSPRGITTSEQSNERLSQLILRHMQQRTLSIPIQELQRLPR